MHSRRNFIRSTSILGGSVLGSAFVPYNPVAYHSAVADNESRIRHLVDVALDSASSMGADYGDIRLTHNYAFAVTTRPPGVRIGEAMSIGVRVLVDGCWGFASSTLWDESEAVRLSGEAVKQASSIARINQRNIEFSPAPLIDNQSWVGDLERDPFSIDAEEVLIHCQALLEYASNYMEFKGASRGAASTIIFDGLKQESVFGSTDGSFCTQSHCLTGGEFILALKYGRHEVSTSTDLLTYSKVGLERLFSPGIRDSIKEVIDDLIVDAQLEQKPLDVGRYETVLDYSSVSNLLSKTVGLATEQDRVMGAEANAGGTSYINDVDSMLGSFKVGSSLLNVSANRSEKGGAATVAWDDEGVKPKDFPLITDGILEGLASSRDLAAQMDGDSRSNGCVSMGYEPKSILAGGGAINSPMIQSPNLIMKGSDSDTGFDDMVQDIQNGMAFKGVNFLMDFQQLNGLGMGNAYEVKNGKITAKIINAALLIRAPEFWSNMISVGGDANARRIGHAISKGEPSQRFYHSVTAPCATFRDATIVDITKKG